jgi:DHA1 family multidrug resistance protein-like MFS transporter
MRRAGPAPGTTRKLFALSRSIALAMSAVGIIIPVVPSHIGRLGLAGASTQQVALHVSLLAAGYALMQLLPAPLWGRLLGTGIFSAAIIPAAFAFVANTTSDENRTRGMAQLSAAAGIGFVIGGLLGGIEPSATGGAP